ncbi:gp436 family protein [Acidimangrovimonas sediminis]|uniref:gp436 family protein n=1 Tax=Acidimangrovimonas sediminis TaxID=2056283 RepID=UPI000C7FBCBC|nr:DUF1320 domain-containing protein [Acidimangrovimonas sediminis]
MTYATQQDLIDRFGTRMLVALTDRGETATGAIDTDVVARALSDTDAVIDGYLAGRYTLPLSVTSPVIEDIAMSIAIWKLHLSAPDDKVKADYDQALRSLREISVGTVRIPGAAGLEPAGTDGSSARSTDRERPMTADNLKGFI